MSSTPASLHQKILGDLQGKILSGKLAPGARLAPQPEQAANIDGSRQRVGNLLAAWSSAAARPVPS